MSRRIIQTDHRDRSNLVSFLVEADPDISGQEQHPRNEGRNSCDPGRQGQAEEDGQSDNDKINGEKDVCDHEEWDGG